MGRSGKGMAQRNRAWNLSCGTGGELGVGQVGMGRDQRNRARNWGREGMGRSGKGKGLDEQGWN